MGWLMLENLRLQPDAERSLQRYRGLAAGYDRTCTRIETLRARAIRELDLRPGETVFDIACGTGPALPDLAAAVGPSGTVIGVELSPEMAALARRRVDAAGLAGRVKVIESAVEGMRIKLRADALLLSYTHDVLQSPAALDRMMTSAKPGARIVVVGMKTLPWPWGWPVNLFNMYRARSCMTTYRDLERPWRLLEARGASLRQVHTALWGSAYIASGVMPGIRAPGTRRAPSTPSSTPRHAGSRKAPK